VEAGVLHAERTEDALAEEGFKRLLRGARDQHTQHGEPHLVHPPFARLVHKRQHRETADPLVRLVRCGRLRRPHAQPLLVRSGQDRIRVRRPQDEAEAHAQGQQVPQRDGPIRGHGVVERPIESLENPAVGQFRQQPIHRLVEAQPAVLHQDHRCRGRNRFGQRADAEDRVAPHRVAANSLRADRVRTHLAPSCD
jgi:hypothetical protein